MGHVVRREDWLSRLSALLIAMKGRAFAWGENDCCTFAADAIEAVTGLNPVPDLRGSYSTRVGAMRWLADRGYAGLAPALDALCGGVKLSTPLMARRGDIVLVQEFGLGVVDGTGATVACLAADHDGLVPLPLRSARVGWAI